MFTSFQQILLKTFFIVILGDIMKVKIFDEEDEKDLEADINEFLENLEGEVVDIKYQVGVGVFSEEQVFCFSAMVVYYQEKRNLFLFFLLWYDVNRGGSYEEG